MTSLDIRINNVSDTSLWVAYYRAKETERPDALFHDPLAKVLVGERGKKIAAHMKTVGRYTEWSVITRTLIIDDYIQTLIGEGIDTVINLGAGLDTRPYRMNLPSSLRWIEVDYPNIIDHKNKLLESEISHCQLKRVALDLADDEKRKQFLSQEASQAKKALVLTEGVIPYLSEKQVSSLARDIHSHPEFAFWVLEFFSPEVYRYVKRNLKTKKMVNAPFLFYPDDWMGFFKKEGWVKKDIRYLGEEALKHGRSIPMPWWGSLIKIFANRAILERSKRMTGFIVLKKG